MKGNRAAHDKRQQVFVMGGTVRVMG